MLHLLCWLSTTFFAQLPTPNIIDGYTNKTSVFPGDSIELYLNARRSSSHYNLRLFDLSGGEVASFPTAVFSQAPVNEKSYQTGYGYRLTKKVRIPDLRSGIYLWENKIPLVIKTHKAEMTVVYPINTINAYCNSGGKSLYGFNSSDGLPAQTVSFLRPMGLGRHSEAFLRWIQKENFPDVGYITDMDLQDYNSINSSRLIIIPGHSEYWTLKARRNFDRFVHDGKNALILSGNTMWWQVRYSKSNDQLICYKDAKEDPVKSPKLKTINWSDLRLGYPILKSTGTDFANAGYGLKNDNGWDGYKIVGSSPLLQDTELKAGNILSCPSDEMDGVPILGITDGTPIINARILGFQKVEIVGFDFVSRGGKEGIGTWIVFKPTRTAGTVINTASTDWCSNRGIGSNRDIQIITRTMIRKLLNDENVFAPEPEPPVVNN